MSRSYRNENGELVVVNTIHLSSVWGTACDIEYEEEEVISNDSLSNNYRNIGDYYTCDF